MGDIPKAVHGATLPDDPRYQALGETVVVKVREAIELALELPGQTPNTVISGAFAACAQASLDSKPDDMPDEEWMQGMLQMLAIYMGQMLGIRNAKNRVFSLEELKDAYVNFPDSFRAMYLNPEFKGPPDDQQKALVALLEKPDGLNGCVAHVQTALRLPYVDAQKLVQILVDQGLLSAHVDGGDRKWL